MLKIILLFLISYINSCGKYNPQILSDCSSNSTDFETCCLYVSRDFKYQCMSFKGKNKGKVKIDDIQLICSENNYISQTLSSPICGNPYPEKLNDCSDYTTNTTSCCLYEVESTKRCYNVGNRFEGSFNLPNYIMTCSAGYISLGIIYIILIYLN